MPLHLGNKYIPILEGRSKYELALQIIASEKGFDPNNFKEYQKQIRYLESKGKYNAIQKPRKGYTTTPGRGAYQYELSINGGSGSARTAINRAKQWTRDNAFELPNDLNEDFSMMSAESQDLVDLLNYRKSPSGNFKYIKERNYKAAYLSHHYAGPNKLEKARYFNISITEYEKENNQSIKNKT